MNVEIASEPAAAGSGLLEGSRPGRVRGFLTRHENFLLGTLTLVVIVVLWQLSANFQIVNPAFTSSPTAIIGAAGGFFSSGQGLQDISVSGTEYVTGVGLALGVGIPLGMMIGWYRRLRALLQPLISILNSTPLIAIAPLFIVWFGIGLASKVAVIFLICLIPILVTTAAGVSAIEQAYIDVTKVFGVGPIRVFWTLILPGSVPAMLAGVRLAVGFGLIGVFVGELISSTAGLGYMINAAGNQFETDLLFVGVSIIAGAGVIFSAILRLIERRVERWKL